MFQKEYNGISLWEIQKVLFVLHYSAERLFEKARKKSLGRNFKLSRKHPIPHLPLGELYRQITLALFTGRFTCKQYLCESGNREKIACSFMVGGGCLEFIIDCTTILPECDWSTRVYLETTEAPLKDGGMTKKDWEVSGGDSKLLSDIGKMHRSYNTKVSKVSRITSHSDGFISDQPEYKLPLEYCSNHATLEHLDRIFFWIGFHSFRLACKARTFETGGKYDESLAYPTGPVFDHARAYSEVVRLLDQGLYNQMPIEHGFYGLAGDAGGILIQPNNWDNSLRISLVWHTFESAFDWAINIHIKFDEDGTMLPIQVELIGGDTLLVRSFKVYLCNLPITLVSINQPQVTNKLRLVKRDELHIKLPNFVSDETRSVILANSAVLIEGV